MVEVLGVIGILGITGITVGCLYFIWDINRIMNDIWRIRRG